MASLLSESQSWNLQLSHFKKFADNLNGEALDLRSKLEKERREAKRLSGVVSESKHKQDLLSKKLSETEAARLQAASELEKIEDLSRELKEQVGMSRCWFHLSQSSTNYNVYRGTRCIVR